MSGTPFCERNMKIWIIPLFLFAIFVVGYSIWAAGSNGRIYVSDYYMSVGRQEPALSTGRQASPPSAMPPDPAARQVAFNKTYSRVHPGGYGGASTYPGPVDTKSGFLLVAGAPPGVDTGTSFNRAADIIRPCVVNINAIRPGTIAQQVANPNDPRFIEPFTGIPDKFIGEMAFESVGSGVIVDSRGYVVTNHHVVADATNIIVSRFRHEGHYTARLVVADPKKDLALLKITGDMPFPVAILTDSNLVEVGDWVIAVGNPFGLEHTVTAGIISAKRSSIVIGGIRYKGLIQTDAPINKGSSGGPLVNMNGQVVGINTAIYAPTGVFNGTGFAIPSNHVGAFVAKFMGKNNVAVAMQRPAGLDLGSLGIGVIEMNEELAQKLSYPHAGGLYVNTLVIGSPADKAEFTRGDIITSVSGQIIRDSASLQGVLAGLIPGQVLDITVWRSGKTETIKLKA